MIVIADFDRTLSRYRTSRGAPVTTSHGVIESCELLDETYRKKARDLADYYIPKEFDPSSSEEERTKVCEEWWSKAHDLLLEYGLTRQQLEDAVRNESNLELREGCEEMFRMLEKNGVPLLIFLRRTRRRDRDVFENKGLCTNRKDSFQYPYHFESHAI